MSNLAQELLKILEEELRANYDPIKIAKICFLFYNNYLPSIDDKLMDFLLRLVVMEEGEEFEMTEKEFRTFIEQLKIM